jgi:FkbM family methyltransferase
LRADGYSGSIVSFEPASEPFRELLFRAERDKKWEAHRIALGEVSGRANLNVSMSDTFNSLLPQTRNAFAFEQQSAVLRLEEIEIVCLDEVCNLQASDRAFLKIDTQGFEKNVLSGGLNTLEAVQGILLEIPIVRMYENVWSFEEAVEFMKSVGFVPSQIDPVNFLWRQDPVSVSEFDCLFRRICKGLDDIQ